MSLTEQQINHELKFNLSQTNPTSISRVCLCISADTRCLNLLSVLPATACVVFCVKNKCVRVSVSERECLHGCILKMFMAFKMQVFYLTFLRRATPEETCWRFILFYCFSTPLFHLCMCSGLWECVYTRDTSMLSLR